MESGRVPTSSPATPLLSASCPGPVRRTGPLLESPGRARPSAQSVRDGALAGAFQLTVGSRPRKTPQFLPRGPAVPTDRNYRIVWVGGWPGGPVWGRCPPCPPGSQKPAGRQVTDFHCDLAVKVPRGKQQGPLFPTLHTPTLPPTPSQAPVQRAGVRRGPTPSNVKGPSPAFLSSSPLPWGRLGGGAGP